MVISKKTPKNIDDYVGRFPEEVQKRLQTMRSAIQRAAANATETISYGIPAFELNGKLVWFAAFKNHIGLYPRKTAMVAFKKELSRYKTAKGSVQFPLDEPLPVGLVSRMVKFRVKENLAVNKEKGK